MKFALKNLLVATIVAAGVITVPAVNAEIQCPNNWIKEVRNSVVVCVAQNQDQAQAQVQNNDQNQNVNQNVFAGGGSSSSSSSSSSDTDVHINNNIAAATPAPTAIPQVVYTAPTKIVTLPATGLPEAAMALSALAPIGYAVKRFTSKKSEVTTESASSIWLEKQSSI